MTTAGGLYTAIGHESEVYHNSVDDSTTQLCTSHALLAFMVRFIVLNLNKKCTFSLGVQRKESDCLSHFACVTQKLGKTRVKGNQQLQVIQ